MSERVFSSCQLTFILSFFVFNLVILTSIIKIIISYSPNFINTIILVKSVYTWTMYIYIFYTFFIIKLILFSKSRNSVFTVDFEP